MIFNIAGIDQVDTVAAEIAKQISNHHVIAFYGGMGAGKTTLIKALCKVMAVTDEVTSPTFSLVNEYITKNNSIIYHFDFYRINNINEAYDFGYEEYFYSGNTCFIEWPELIEPILPPDTLKIKIEATTNEFREITILQ